MEVALVAADTQFTDGIRVDAVGGGTCDVVDPSTGWVSAFGGVMQWGLGREFGTGGLMEHLEVKTRSFGDL